MPNMPKKPVVLWLSILEFVAGLVVMATGTGILTIGGLGTAPISTLPLACSYVWPISFGMATFFMNAFCLFLQWCLLRQNFPLRNLLQLPACFFFGMAIDVAVYSLAFFASSYYFFNVFSTFLGSFVLAFGVLMLMHSKVTLLPGEGLIYAVSLVTRKDFGYLKVLGDLSFVVCAVILEGTMLWQITAVREGTLIAALSCGLFVKMLQRLPCFKGTRQGTT